jgi:GDPmannose 4,6-dehydratase
LWYYKKRRGKMQKKKALVFGISGQDGSYLAELLLENDYEVYGMVRRNSVPEHQDTRLDHLSGLITTEYGDLLDTGSIDKMIKNIQPDEIYNLAAQSHVGISSEIPRFTIQVNTLGALNVLESCRVNCPTARFYQASSSEMFGNCVDKDGFQRETTLMHPVSPYGCSKLFAYSLVRHYRRAYKMFVCNGILFNHESPRRGSNFVTQKVAKAAVEIKLGLRDKLVLGNLDTHRDWSHAKDMVRGMHMIMNHSEPDDIVLASMQAHSIRDLCIYAFKKLGLDYQKYVVQDAKYMRPEELKFLKGDSTKARTILKWQPEYTFETLLDDMVDSWVNKLGN